MRKIWILFLFGLVFLAVGIFGFLLFVYFKLSFSVSEFSSLINLPEKGEKGQVAINGEISNEDEHLGSEEAMNRENENNILMLYPSKENGRIWKANWSNGNQRSLRSGQNDPFDQEFVARGNGTIFIDGKGIAQIEGDAPRMYVYDPEKREKWGDVEVTVYARRIAETGASSSQGIVVGARSEHQDASSSTPCKGTTYYGRLLFDGRAVFQKELVHEFAYSTNKPSEENVAEWETAGGTMPLNKWIGMKFVVMAEPDGRSVKLELYRDLTDGFEGGKWEKVAEYADDGKWFPNSKKVDIEKMCGFPADHVLTAPGTSVFIRNDLISKMEYKNFTIREITQTK